MADQPFQHKMTEAMKGQQAEADLQGGTPPGPPEPSGPGSNPAELAEEARRQNEARLHGRDREDQLITTGRADQTTGRT